MIVYNIIAVNKITGDIDHVSTSDAPHVVNPFDDIASTHDIEEYEFTGGDKLIRAREFMSSIEHVGGVTRFKTTTNRSKMSNLQKKPTRQRGVL